MLKVLMYGYNREYFVDRLTRTKCLLFHRKGFVKHNLYLSVVVLRTLKHKKSPLLYIYMTETGLKKIKNCQLQTYLVSS